MRKVFTERDRPFCRVAYSGGYFITMSTLTSWSKTREKTAPRMLKILAMKKIPLRSTISIR